MLLVAIDYDPSTLAELKPMTDSILGQAWDRGARIILTSLSQFAPAMAQGIIEKNAKEHGKTNGVDYVFLGYKPYPAITILAMGTDFRVPFPNDHYGTPLDAIPMMRDIHNYRNVKAVISLAASDSVDNWVQYGNAKYGVPLAIGVAGVMASDYYPFLQSGQIFGIIPGMKGAAEYEQLTGRKGEGSRGMPYQVATHIVILAFIVVSNIGYIARRRALRAAGGEGHAGESNDPRSVPGPRGDRRGRNAGAGRPGSARPARARPLVRPPLRTSSGRPSPP